MRARVLSQWRLNLSFIVAIASFWATIFGPLFLAILGWQLLGDVWNAPAFGGLGSWRSIEFVIAITLFFDGLFLFGLFALRLPRIWSGIPRVTASPSGVLVEAGEAPKLHELLSRAQARTRFLGHVEIWIDLTGGTRATRYKAAASSARRPAVILGLPTMEASSIEVVEFVLAYLCAAFATPQFLLDRVVAISEFARRVSSPPSPAQYQPRSAVDFFSFTRWLCQRALANAQAHAIEIARTKGQPNNALAQWQTMAGQFPVYWQRDLGPLLETGHLPPVAEGFRLFVQSNSPVRLPDNTPATSLLRSASAIEAKLIRLAVQQTGTLEPIAWEQAAKVLLQSWQDQVHSKSGFLAGTPVRTACNIDLTGFGRHAFHQPGRLYDPQTLSRLTIHLFAVALAVQLSRDGWEFLYHGPGSPFAFQKHGRITNPFALFERLTRRVPADDWLACCSEAGVEAMMLA